MFIVVFFINIITNTLILVYKQSHFIDYNKKLISTIFFFKFLNQLLQSTGALRASQINMYDVSLFDGRHKEIKLEKAMYLVENKVTQQ